MHESIDPIERQLANLPGAHAAKQLRSAVLAGVEQQLRVARRDRRMLRFAAAVVCIGLGLNLTAGWDDGFRASRPAFAALQSDTLTQFAITVADATDAETGGKFARQIAALHGEILSDAQMAEIERQVKLRSTASTARKAG